MSRVYSTYEAKARFSEILRKVRGGESVLITYRGDQVAEIRPVERKASVEERLEELRRRGILSGPGEIPRGALKPVAKRPGGLGRFLESRE